MNFIKFIALVIIQSTLAFFPCAASPLVTIGDVADIYFTGSSSVRMSSNVFRNEFNEEEDFIFTVSPGVELSFARVASNIDLRFLASQDIVRYDEFSDELNTEMLHLKAVGAYRTSRWDLNALVSFDEQQSNTGFANADDTLIESEDTRANFNAEYHMSPKFSFGSGFSYGEKKYIKPENIFSNYDRFQIPFDLYYEWTPKVDLSVGYRYSQRDVEHPSLPDNGYETTSHFINVGARGALLPKLSGSFKFGYTLRDSESTTGSPRDGSDGILGLDADLSWAPTTKLTNKIFMSRDFGVSGDGNVTEVSSIQVSSQYLVSNNWSASSRLGYTLRSYQDANVREDDQYTAGLNINFLPNQYWSFSGGYQYLENKSNQAGLSYVDHILSIAASLRY